MLVMAAFVAVAGGKTWDLQGSTYTVDTLYHAKVGPGTTQTSLKIAGSLDLRVFYTTTDLTDPNVEMRVAKAGNLLSKVATVTNLSKSNSVEGAQYFVGVNADFFDMSSGYPNGSNILNSEVYNLVGSGNWTEISFDAAKIPNISKISMTGSVAKADGSSFDIYGVNKDRAANCLVVYSHRKGTTTGTNAWGSEVVVTPVESGATIALGKTVKMKVSGTPATSPISIPTGSYVLSGHGTAATFVNSLTDGEEIEVTMSATTANGKTENPVWAVGGCPVLLKDGVVQETEDANIISHLPNKEPRTAVGYDATGTKVVMMIVDGRSAISDGCRTKILADIMREVGCSDAMNFDGGGSSEMYHQRLGIRNVPSGGSERAVTNGLFAVATTPTDNNVAEIRFVDWVKSLPKYGLYTPKFYGYNKYGVLVDTDLQGVQLSCPAELGEIVDNGTSLLGTGGGTYALTGTYNGLTSTLVVTVDDSTEPYFRCKHVLLDSYNDYESEIISSLDGEELRLDNSLFTWSVDDNTVASVDAAGNIKGLSNGETSVRCKIGSKEMVLPVIVEIPESHYLPLDKSFDISTWSMEHGTAIETSSLSVLGTEGYAVDYTISSSGSGTKTFSIKKDLQTWSRPDSVFVDINPCESTLKSVSLYYEDGEGTQKVSRKSISSITSNAVTRILFPFDKVVDVTDMSCFPITFKRLLLQVGDAAGVSNRIEVPRIQLVYTSVPLSSSGVESVMAQGAEGGLLLSPNPVVSGAVVKMNVSEPVQYTVSAMNGAVVKRGEGVEISTAGLTSGVYIVSVKNGGNKSVAKLIVK